MLRRRLYVARTFKQTRGPSIISIHHGHRAFSISAPTAAKPMPPRPSVKEDELEEAFLRGSGPGGQKIAGSLSTNTMPVTNIVHV